MGAWKERKGKGEAPRSRNFGNMAEYPERNLLPLVRIGNEI